MAKKTEPTVDGELMVFKGILERGGYSGYSIESGIIFTAVKDATVLIIPEPELFNSIITDTTDTKIVLDTIDISTVEGNDKIQWIEYAKKMNQTWISMTDTDDLYKGKLLKVSINGYKYEIPLNKELLPLKLKKLEYCDIAYCIYPDNTSSKVRVPVPVLGIKKYFTPNIAGHGFTIMRLFKII